MTEIPLTVAPNRLRAVANRVERCAHTLARFEFPGLDPDALAGSLVGNIPSPAWVASGLPDVLALMRWWADTARLSASAFENTDRDNAARM
jgi:hypothetical protein